MKNDKKLMLNDSSIQELDEESYVEQASKIDHLLKVQKRKKELHDEEIKRNIMCFVWLSFADATKPKGTQFNGVILTKALGSTDALIKTHKLNINPGGAS